VNATWLFARSPEITGPTDISIFYPTQSAVATEMLLLPAIEIGSLEFPADGEWTIELSTTDSQWHKSVTMNAPIVRRCFLSLGAPGEYSGSARLGDVVGPIVADGESTFWVTSAPAFLPRVSIVTRTATPTPIGTADVRSASPSESAVHSPGNGGLSTTEIILIAVTATLGVVLIIVLVLWLASWHRGKQPKSERSASMGDLLMNPATNDKF
jgi:hypothetical protein